MRLVTAAGCAAILGSLLGGAGTTPVLASPRASTLIPGSLSAVSAGSPQARAIDARSGLMPASTTLAGSLTAVSADSAADAWAVGYRCASSACISTNTLILHWNGSAWSKAASPVAAGTLQGVKAVTPTNAWAVGYSYATTGLPAALILHWDGTDWDRVSLSVRGASYSYLYGVSAAAASSAWAVGYYNASSQAQTLTLRWNGTTWAKVASPNAAAGFSDLTGVSVVPSTTSAWAVGDDPFGNEFTTLLLSWNGSTWANMPPDQADQLEAVTAITATNAWAVGSYTNGGNLLPLILKWDGTTWSRVPSPNPGGGNGGELSAAAATSPADAWAVGFYSATNYKTLILRWDGTSWSQSRSPSPATDSYLNGVTGTSPANAWAVGNTCTDTSCTITRTLILHWNGTSWSQA